VIDNALIVLAILILSLAVTANSLWIDEGFTAWIAGHGSLLALVNEIAPSAEDRQYPMYGLWILAWTHLFGSSEYAMRAANIPFGALYVIALALSSRLIFRRRFAWLPFAVAPFAWFYMNEARQYMMLLASATASAGALGVAIFGPQEARTRAFSWFLWLSLLTCMTNILAFLAFPGVLLLLVAARERSASARFIASRALLFAPLFALVVCYYISTFAQSGAAAEIAENRGSSLAFSAENVYEQAGLAGIGPSRNAAHARPVLRSLLQYAVPLTSALMAYLLALILSLRKRPDPPPIAFLGAWVASLAFSAIVSYELQDRFLGRHMSAILPFLLIGSIGLFRSRIAVLLIAGVFVVSDFRLSLVPEYGKDDYRSAVNAVIERTKHTGGTIDWAADTLTAKYYGLVLHYTGHLPFADVVWRVRGTGMAVANWSNSRAEQLVGRQVRSGPVYVAMSRPDVYDIHGAWSRIVHRPGVTLLARFQSFEIYSIGKCSAAPGDDRRRSRPSPSSLAESTCVDVHRTREPAEACKTGWWLARVEGQRNGTPFRRTSSGVLRTFASTPEGQPSIQEPLPHRPAQVHCWQARSSPVVARSSGRSRS